MASFLSQSAELLAGHPHLLEGGVSRGLMYLAAAAIIGMRIWLRLVPAGAFDSGKRRLGVGVLGWVGLLLTLNGLALQVAYPFGRDTMPVLADGASYLQVLRGSFGFTWLVYGFCLALALFTLRSCVAWLFALGMVFALAANSHAGENGFLTWAYGIDVAHLLLGLVWLGGVLVLAWDRLAGRAWIGMEALRTWSRLALPLFLALLVFGIFRLALGIQEAGWLNDLYLALLGLKILAVLVVVFSAWKIRKAIQPGCMGLSGKFDDALSLELFAAFILILMTALLTQLQPN